MSNRIPFALLAGILAFGFTPALAQEEGDGDTRSGGLLMEEVIVTGTAGSVAISKFETSYAISTFGEDAIQTKAPINVSDMLTEVPGFWSETSGGEGGNNLFVRGIPADGSFRYAPLLEDGLPLYEEAEIPFGNADQLARIDLTTERVEVVRGGPASIFHSNAPGGAVNFITRKGTEDFQGTVQLELGDYDHVRTDFHMSGPITDSVLYSIGGYYRVNDGVRDPGFKANEGGQFRATLDFLLDDGGVTLSWKQLNDATIFYLPIPLLDPGDPDSIPGLDANEGTLTSNDYRRVFLKDPEGGRIADMSDGINPEINTFTSLIDLEIGDGWFLKNNSRYVDGDMVFNAAFSLTEPQAAQDYLDSRLADAQAAFAGTDSLAYRFTNDSDAVFDIANQNGNGLVIPVGWWAQKLEMQNFQNDLQINHLFEAGDQTHDVTFGFYYSAYDLGSFWNFNEVLTEVRDAPRALDVIALDATGAEVGSVTDNGFTKYGTFGVDATDDVTTWALYLADNWQVTDQLRVDLGFRYQDAEMSGSYANFSSFDLGDPTTLADDDVLYRDGTFTPYSEDFDGNAFTVGANFEVNESLAVFGRYSDAFRIPRTSAIWLNADLTVEDISQLEGGVKVETDTLQVFAVAFYSEFDDFAFQNQVVDPGTGDIVTLDLKTATETLGLEWEVNWAPDAIPVEFAFTGTLQQPEYNDFIFDEVDPGTGEVTTFNFDGNQIRRIPEVILAFRPVWRFDAGNMTGKAYMTVTYNGERYVDAANETELPDFTTIDAGVVLDLSDEFSVQLHGANLSDEVGLTEGNPRTGQIFGSGQTFAFGRPILGRSIRLISTYRF